MLQNVIAFAYSIRLKCVKVDLIYVFYHNLNLSLTPILIVVKIHTNKDSSWN